jgi:hypothetical protein
MQHAPRAGGNEHTFEPAGGYEWSFGVDDNANDRVDGSDNADKSKT